MLWAQAAADEIASIERLLEASGVRTDLETAVFDLDQGIRPGAQLERRLVEREPIGPGVRLNRPVDTLEWNVTHAPRRRLRRRHQDAGLRPASV